MADNILEKLPPQALDAEMAVLGSMLIDAQAVERAFDTLKPEHFYKDAHKKIFTAMRNVSDKNQAVDMITITEELKNSKHLAQVGGEVYLSELIDKVSTSAHVEHYAEIVYKKFLVRDLIRISTNVVQECFKQEDEPEKLIDLAQEQIFKISQKQDIKGFVAAKDMVEDVMHAIERARLDKNPVKGVPTGFTEFDYKTGGFRKSDLIIIGARPSQGKTALALNMAHYASVVKNIPVALFSLEMGKNSIFERMLCSAAMADVHQVRSGIFKMEKWRDLTREATRLANAPFFIDDTPGITITDIRMRARRLASELEKEGKQLGMIMIDYLQLIRSTGRFESRQQEVSEISRMLKELARILNVPVIALSQLSRKNEDRSRVDNKPQLSDLRESGSIEQDADVVALIHRDGYYKRDDESLKRKATLIIAKQRNGPVGDVPLNFISEHTLFTNPAPEDIPVGDYGQEVGVPL
ncbi:replicative DNA helicase [Elusimicrobium simillimum]|uniref:replicative DNA helicase n=1 Tax=Elusimicrobium simillimum TaxID=3143438 RepID=UPI003C6F563D